MEKMSIPVRFAIFFATISCIRVERIPLFTTLAKNTVNFTKEYVPPILAINNEYLCLCNLFCFKEQIQIIVTYFTKNK